MMYQARQFLKIIPKTSGDEISKPTSEYVI